MRWLPVFVPCQSDLAPLCGRFPFSLMRLFTSHTSQPKAAALALLATITLSLYLPVRNYLFLSFDDPLYVTANEHVLRGLSLQNLIWAVSNMSAGFWQSYCQKLWMEHQAAISSSRTPLMNVTFSMTSPRRR